MNHITIAYNRFRNDPDRMDMAYDAWLDQQADDADTSWEAFQAECRANYEQALADHADAEHEWRKAS